MALTTYYRQFFWKMLEIGAFPDFMIRSKIRTNLEVQLKALQGDGNMEKQQEKLSEFLDEIKSMPIGKVIQIFQILIRR